MTLLGATPISSSVLRQHTRCLRTAPGSRPLWAAANVAGCLKLGREPTYCVRASTCRIDGAGRSGALGAWTECGPLQTGALAAHARRDTALLHQHLVGCGCGHCDLQPDRTAREQRLRPPFSDAQQSAAPPSETLIAQHRAAFGG